MSDSSGADSVSECSISSNTDDSSDKSTENGLSSKDSDSSPDNEKTIGIWKWSSNIRIGKLKLFGNKSDTIHQWH